MLTDEQLREIEEREKKATPGPWAWTISLRSKAMRLESHGRGQMLEYIMDFMRWGMGGAKARFLDREKSLMVDADKLTRVIPGRAHHSEWAQEIDHPDADFISGARTDIPALLQHIREQAAEIERLREDVERLRDQVTEKHNMWGKASGERAALQLRYTALHRRCQRAEGAVAKYVAEMSVFRDYCERGACDVSVGVSRAMLRAECERLTAVVRACTGRTDPVLCASCGACRERAEVVCGQCTYRLDGSDGKRVTLPTPKGGE